MNYFINHYGEKAQLEKLHEEAWELVEALSMYLRGDDTLDHVKEEMADVSNLIQQFSEHWNDGSIYSIIYAKRKRQIERIKSLTKNNQDVK